MMKKTFGAKMSKHKLFLRIICLISIISCSHHKNELSDAKNLAKITTSAPEVNLVKVVSLKEEEAQQRFLMIKNVNYQLYFQFQEKQDNYKGKAVISFEALTLDQSLHLDFYQGKIDRVLVNQVHIKNINYENSRINFPASQFHAGVNTIEIDFENSFSKDGSGLYKFLDPTDGEEYFYSDFEPFDANKLFPAFDQPDLRATFELQVEVPTKWQVIANTRESKIEEKEHTRLWTFPRTLDFSTYVFALHFGAYEYVEDNSGKIPLRLYFRKSLSKFVEKDQAEWFKVTQEGFSFFENYFTIPYPFEKYDQVLVPDFNSGAMENVAAVTFNDSRYVFRSEATQAQKEKRANVILHEMAHMWFGDLVTMKWWNGLWLNESFATFMATMAQSKATDYKDAWQTFFNDIKAWAYWEDNLVTSHPIEASIADTASAFNNFDGITYGKGASALKQLNFLLGPEAFQNGVTNYLKEHSHSNTKLRDFISALEKSSRQDLTLWTKEWLESNGHNRVEVSFKCSAGRISTFTLKQSNADQSIILRTHKTIIALFKRNADQQLEVIKELPFRFSKAEQNVPSLIGEQCPDMVYPNFMDHGFFKVDLDAKSLELIKSQINQINHVLTRNMIWKDLWDMVLIGKISLFDYAKLILTHLPKERNYYVLYSTLYSLQGNSSSVSAYLQKIPSSSKDYDAALSLLDRLEQFYFKKLSQARPSSEDQKLWLDGFISFASRPFALGTLESLYSGKIKINGLELDQDRKWKILQVLSTYDWKNVSDYLDQEEKIDHSDRGKKSKLAALAAKPEMTNKNKWYEFIFTNPDQASLSELKDVMNNLMTPHQENINNELSLKFYRDLETVVATKEQLYMTKYAWILSPKSCDSKQIETFKKYLQDHANFPVSVDKALKVNLQESERCHQVLLPYLELLIPKISQ